MSDAQTERTKQAIRAGLAALDDNPMFNAWLAEVMAKERLAHARFVVDAMNADCGAEVWW